MYLNAGGVTVSYFEWLKNLNHVSFGRLTFKYQRDAQIELLQSISAALEEQFGVSSRVERLSQLAERLQTGHEREIVNAALDYTMERSARQMLEAVEQHRLGLDLRAAAYVTALQKIFQVYVEAGFTL